jgi:hypothetical protein
MNKIQEMIEKCTKLQDELNAQRKMVFEEFNDLVNPDYYDDIAKVDPKFWLKFGAYQTDLSYIRLAKTLAKVQKLKK